MPKMSDTQIMNLIYKRVHQARKRGLRIDMSFYGIWPDDGGTWRVDAEANTVCMIGAALLDTEVQDDSLMQSFANWAGRDPAWALGFMEGSLGRPCQQSWGPEWDAGFATAQNTIRRLDAHGKLDNRDLYILSPERAMI